MGKANYFASFKQNADEFICSTLPGFSHQQVQYSPGIPSPHLTFIFEKSESPVIMAFK